MDRSITSEILDSLSHDHAEAVANRRALRFFNGYLGTGPWFRRVLIPHLGQQDRILELGAGEGLLSRMLYSTAGRINALPASWTLLDCKPVFDQRNEALNYVVEDLLHYPAYHNASVVIGNLILHQFDKTDLLRLGSRLERHARLLVFQETARQWWTYGLCRLATLPMGRVTRHDAPVSVRAGFKGNELPQSLGLDPGIWDWRIETTVRGAYRLVAEKK